MLPETLDGIGHSIAGHRDDVADRKAGNSENHRRLDVVDTREVNSANCVLRRIIGI